MRHGMLKFSPDRIMLTQAQIWGRDSRTQWRGESSAHSSCRRFGRRGVATPEGETDDEKKVPNIENEKKREREGGGKSSPSAFPHSQLSRRRGRRRCRSLSRSLEDHSQVFPASLSPSSLSRRRKTVQVTLSLLLHPTCEKWPKIRV